MNKITGRCKYMMWALSIIAVVFGLMTIKSGGQVLFGDEIYRTQAGNYLPHVVMFNFTAGFFYVLAGLGLHLQKKISAILPWAIAFSTLFIFSMFSHRIYEGVLYEMRTVYAMSFRSALWIFISVFVYIKFWRKKVVTE